MSAGLWKEWVYAIEEFLPGPCLLELGHGPGHLQIRLALAGHCISGLDRSQHMGRQAFRRMQKHALLPQLVCGVAQALPYRSDLFDQVAATFPTEYIVDPQSLGEIRRVLRPGGQLILLPAARVTGNSLAARFSNFAYRVTGQDIAWDRANYVYLTQPFRKAGFDIELAMRRVKNSELIILIGRPQAGGQPSAD